MKNNTSKIHKFFESLIYTILMTLPLISVFVRSIYVQSNDNAKDSYYASTLSDDEKHSFTGNQQVIDYEGNIYFDNNLLVGTTRSSSVYFSGDIEYITGSWSDDTLATFNANVNDITRIYYYRGTSLTIYAGENSILSLGASNLTGLVLRFTGITGFSSTSAFNAFYYLVDYKYNYLDNAFEYSLNDIVTTYGKGNINFVNWLGDLFFNNTNDLLYFNFVNLYLNYALVVSVAYLIWFILDWFIKFVKGLLNSFLPKGD